MPVCGYATPPRANSISYEGEVPEENGRLEKVLANIEPKGTRNTALIRMNTA